MKERNGFVSNSSSSSFVVFTEKRIETKEQLKDLFKNLKFSKEAYKNTSYEKLELEDLLETLFEKFTTGRFRKEEYLYDVLGELDWQTATEEERQQYEDKAEFKKINWKKYENFSKEIHAFYVTDNESVAEAFIMHQLDWDSLEIEYFHIERFS